MSRVLKLILISLLLCFSMSILTAADTTNPDETDPGERGMGSRYISIISRFAGCFERGISER